MGKNIQEFIANSQGYQSQLIQLAAESLRRQKYNPVGAIFQFMFVENWPSLNWGVVDYWRSPKPGYAALQKAYQPILPSIEWAKNSFNATETPTFGLWLINDTQNALKDIDYEWTLWHAGQLVDKKTLRTQIGADHASKVGEVVMPALQSGSYQLRTRLVTAQGNVVGENSYEFAVN
jgi:beta-mannosidase